MIHPREKRNDSTGWSQILLGSTYYLPHHAPACFHPAVLSLRSSLKYWLPVVLWMTLIFAGSGDSKSGNRSSRLIGPLVRFFVPDVSPDTLEMIILGVRKTAHLTEYTVLAILVWCARRQQRRGEYLTWRWRDARWALLICVLYAATDEWHQSFVPNREAAVHDVFIDAIGATGGLVLVWVVSRWKRKD